MPSIQCFPKPTDASPRPSDEIPFQSPDYRFLPSKLDEPKRREQGFSGEMNTTTSQEACYFVSTQLGNSVAPVRRFHDTVDELLNLAPNWNGYGSEAPNKIAAINAKTIVDGLVEIGMTPDRIVASAENGIGIYMKCDARYAIVECLNDGQIVAGLSNRRGFIENWEFAPEPDEVLESLQRISGFLNE